MELSGNLSEFWWEAPKGEVHTILTSVIKHLRTYQRYRHDINIQNLKLYGNANVAALGAYSFGQSSNWNGPSGRITYNIIESMCDTVTQKIAKNKIKPMFLTSGADRSLKRKAEDLNAFTEGLFYETGFYDNRYKTFLDSTIFGTLAVHLYRVKDKIKAERVFIDELEVDDAEVMYGSAPQSMYRMKLMPRASAMRIWPKYKQSILSAKRAEEYYPTHRNLSTLIEVYEAWHLPDEEGKNGRHVLCIDNASIEDEVWKKKYFPFVFGRYKPRPIGFFGVGIAEQITGSQVEINKLLRIAQSSMNILGTPAVLVEKNAGIVKTHLNNEVGRIIEYQGTPPMLWNQNPVPQQILEQIKDIANNAFNQIGVSLLSAASIKPAGLDSGKALRTYNDIESERFALTQSGWEDVHCEAARHMVDLCREIKEEHGDMEVYHPNKRFMRKMKWSEVEMPEKDYIIQCFPTSFLSSTPYGRLQDVQELVQAGFIDKPSAMKLFDFPDLKSHVNLQVAAVENIETQIDNMLDKGIFEVPEPFQDLAYGIPMVQAAYLQAKNENVPEERLELCRRWIELAKETLDSAKAEEAKRMMMAQQAAMAPPAPPIGAPMPGEMLPAGVPTALPEAPPTSELIPNVPV